MYFKSTDGHQRHWKFNLRRLNLHLCDILGEHGGAVLVDSTRRGKAMSDALRWTVPIWVAVINRALFPQRVEFGGLQAWWKEDPSRERGVGDGPGEGSVRRMVEEIEERLVGFVDDFRRLGVDVEDLRGRLRRPILVVWEVNGMDLEVEEEKRKGMIDAKSRDINLLVLCSASCCVKGTEISESGYIQGAADDSEGWAHGLTPELFWKHHEKLLTTSEDEMPDVVSGLLQDNTVLTSEAALIKPTTNISIGSDQNQHAAYLQEFDLVVNCSRKESAGSRRVVSLDCPIGKAGSTSLRKKLPVIRSLVADTFQRKSAARILFTCATGRDLSIGAALLTLCFFFDDTGQLQKSLQPEHSIDKLLVKQRLAWISSSKPDIQPSRSTLQAVNSILMEPP